MTTKKYAIPERVAKMALKYGKNVSAGIQEMHRIVKEKQEADSIDRL
jgi:hypothetical protein